ncbi:hypothetical protein D8B26_005252 [Coccidioides posadasii str. Silveira]|uniref:Uncharacterized protein n=3 Tax=Coccidioides TaxID=5500 RepID=E9D4P5_COCPS|nr:hypothetical protein CPC735_058010 [Coccidioides posadasii C735 delta SOWgp]EER24431.1 hypothetical protein CPC735_058010 [Coccidioides posadasii C735 delta SOWgp]EFW18478.1 conserved hypothetical protein [Coccidioides posadasii str. Silveira]KMU80672.1 hypothetical protein CISG_08662 [Coccidioides immitis RMSCC 3703]QVM10595.1 hypothetical protein D8B26_005252 [Coccidioides posadasii str. Silveira]|eukprot:XP_003066576.1 hypothetical protein CPC735_058010 [Coccidioides posadasii C735 delta SOWgp]
MGSLFVLFSVYVLGGVTFIPVVFGLLFLHAYLTLPSVENAPELDKDGSDGIHRSADDQSSVQSGTDVLAEKFQRTHESDVAAGYFTVCREYVPGGVNGKPPERTTPAGEVITPESPSVYQSMYRSIFERKQAPTIDPAKPSGKNIKKGRNVFYIVLRHGHLMLYDDSEQVEVRYVISLSHYDVSIYGGGESIPEGELWIKRNAVCLSRKSSQSDVNNPQVAALPFYIFSDNPSEKEDLYFAILKNLEKLPDSPISPPTAQHFDVKDIVNLVKRLHSSEENLQTRWFNALVGRLFLALYKTSELESHIWMKIAKKISRVKKPNFITSIVLRKINAGEGAPLITNPRLKDLTVDGNCCVEADVMYDGNFRIEIAATARIDLGTRFKAREVDLVLAVVLKKLKGHGLVRFKPPPSNRLWVSFETMPEMEMTIEPIVSSRQITYGVILRAIESRIREVIGETLVQPFWDDVPFLDTSRQPHRGGIWQATSRPISDHGVADDFGVEQRPAKEPSDEVLGSEGQTVGVVSLSPPPSPDSNEQNKSTLTLDDAPAEVDNISQVDLHPPPGQGSSEPELPLTSDSSSAEHMALDTKLEDTDATSTMVDLPTYSNNTYAGSLHHRSRQRSISFQKSHDHFTNCRSRTDSILSKASTSSIPESSDGDSAGLTARNINHQEGSPTTRLGSSPSSPKPLETRQTMSSLGSAAAAAAKKWGWNVLGRTDQSQKVGGTVIPDHPIGRGRPLPPPGTPLPPPEKSTFRVNPISMPKRKPLAPHLFPETAERSEKNLPERKPMRHRKSTSSTKTEDSRTQEELLIIRAPCGSEPNSPLPAEAESPEKAPLNGENTDKQSVQNENLPGVSAPPTTKANVLDANGHEESRRTLDATEEVIAAVNPVENLVS